MIYFDSDTAVTIGLNQAILLSWINQTIAEKGVSNGVDQYKWLKTTHQQIHEALPFWSKTTIGRIIKELKEWEIIETGDFNDHKMDKTTWIRIKI
jgi:hypothetical protein